MAGRVEGVELVHGTVNLVQSRAHGFNETPCQGRWHHPVALTGEQRIVEVFP